MVPDGTNNTQRRETLPPFTPTGKTSKSQAVSKGPSGIGKGGGMLSEWTGRTRVLTDRGRSTER